MINLVSLSFSHKYLVLLEKQENNTNKLYDHLIEQLKIQKAKKQLQKKQMSRNSRSLNFNINFRDNQPHLNLALQGS